MKFSLQAFINYMKDVFNNIQMYQIANFIFTAVIPLGLSLFFNQTLF